MSKTSGYWHKATGRNWRFLTQKRADDFNPMAEAWLPISGPVSFAFVTRGVLSYRQIRKLYGQTRKLFGVYPWYVKLWNWLWRLTGQVKD